MAVGDVVTDFAECVVEVVEELLGDRLFVALQANGDVGHSGKGLGFIVSMARVALESLVHMLLVVKGDRLISF